MNNTLPLLHEPNKFKDTKSFIDYSYSKFLEIFNPNIPQIFFNNKPVMARPKILNCANCGYHCNNTFECKNCPFKDKLDIFQHICSDEDPTLNVLPEYKDKQNRTPGIFNKKRTSRIAWLKFIIENYKNEKLVRYYNSECSTREINHFFWLYNEHYVLILVEEKKNNKIFIRSCYDIKSDDDEKKFLRHYTRYLKFVKKECP